jgi:hypothetical protein
MSFFDKTRRKQAIPDTTPLTDADSFDDDPRAGFQERNSLDYREYR